MMRNKTKQRKNKKELLRLGLAAAASLMLCALLGFGVLYYYFAPRDNGSQAFEVPALVGLRESEIGKLEGIELRREWIYSEDVERGVVISQTPHGGARRKIAPGDKCTVTIYISLGERTETVPDLVGVDSLSAAAALRSIGAHVRFVDIYGDGDDGSVIDTLPASGSEIRRGDAVTVYVAREKRKDLVSVPDFCGLEYSEAVRLAMSLGLFIRECEGEGRVISQSIPHGASVLAHSYISFETDGEMHERSWPPVVE